MSASLLRKVSYNVRRFTDDSLDVSDISHLLSSFQVHKSNVFYDLFKHRNLIQSNSNRRNPLIASKSLKSFWIIVFHQSPLLSKIQFS